MTHGFNIRPARIDDLPSIARFWRRGVLSTGVTYEIGDEEADLLAKLETHYPSQWTLDVVERGGALVAFLALDKQAPILAELFVDPAHQSCGIGVVLLNRTKAAFQNGFTLWTDERNTRARAFYEREGLNLVELIKHPVASHYRAHYRWAGIGRVDN